MIGPEIVRGLRQEARAIAAAARPAPARRPPRPALPRRLGALRLPRGRRGPRPGHLRPRARAAAVPAPRGRPRVPAPRAPEHVPERAANTWAAPADRPASRGRGVRRGATVDAAGA